MISLVTDLAVTSSVAVPVAIDGGDHALGGGDGDDGGFFEAALLLLLPLLLLELSASPSLAADTVGALDGVVDTHSVLAGHVFRAFPDERPAREMNAVTASLQHRTKSVNTQILANMVTCSWADRYRVVVRLEQPKHAYVAVESSTTGWSFQQVCVRRRQLRDIYVHVLFD